MRGEGTEERMEFMEGEDGMNGGRSEWRAGVEGLK